MPWGVGHELEGSASDGLRVQVVPAFHQVPGNDGGARESHVDLEWSGNPIQLEFHRQVIDCHHFIDRFDLRAICIARVFRQDALKRVHDILGGQVFAVVKSESGTQLEGPGQAVVGLRPVFRDSGIGFRVRIQVQQRRIDLLDDDMRHSARTPRRIKSTRISRERSDQRAPVLALLGQ